MSTGRILTLRQFAEQRQRAAATRYGLKISQVRSAYPRRWYGSEWWVHVMGQVNAGVLPSAAMWRAFSDRQQTELLGTPRALRNETFRRQLVELGSS